MHLAFKFLAPVGEVIFFPRELKASAILCLFFHLIVEDETKFLLNTLTASKFLLKEKWKKTTLASWPGFYTAYKKTASKELVPLTLQSPESTVK